MKEPTEKKGVKHYNALFPLWMLLLYPPLWLVVLPGNLIIDSLVLLIAMCAMKIEQKKQWYKSYILKIFLFGMLSDIVGASYMLLMVFLFEAGGPMGDSPTLTVPALIISASLIFIFNYFVTFKGLDRLRKLKLALTFALATAPYTFLMPSALLYGYGF